MIWGVPTLDGRYLPWLAAGTYPGHGDLPWMRGGAYLGWGNINLPWPGGTHHGLGVPTLGGGYLPWTGVLSLAQWVPSLEGDTYPEQGVTTLDRGYLVLKVGIPLLAKVGTPTTSWKVGTPPLAGR